MHQSVQQRHSFVAGQSPSLLDHPQASHHKLSVTVRGALLILPYLSPQAFIKSALEPHQRTRRAGELLTDLLLPITRTFLDSRYLPFSSSLNQTITALERASDYVFDSPFQKVTKTLESEIHSRHETTAHLTHVSIV